MNDAVTLWLGPMEPGTQPQTVENSQCKLSTSGMSVSGSGNTLSFAVPVTFKPNTNYQGLMHIYQYGEDIGGLVSGWQERGTWEVPTAAGLEANPAPPDFSVIDGGKGPPTAGGQGCGKPNCNWMTSWLTYVSPNKAFGSSATFTTGPGMSFFTNFAHAEMWNNDGYMGWDCPGGRYKYG